MCFVNFGFVLENVFLEAELQVDHTRESVRGMRELKARAFEVALFLNSASCSLLRNLVKSSVKLTICKSDIF